MRVHVCACMHMHVRLCMCACVPSGVRRCICYAPVCASDDHSRVKLSYIDDDPGSDYINANYMPVSH